LARLDRYVLSQLTGPFAIFALILIGIYWVGRAIGLFDQLIGDGQSVGVFLEIMILFLPQVIAIVLPVVTFAAAIYVANRMHSESEIVVVQAAGVAPMSMLKPFLIFGLMVAIFAAILSHYLVPVSAVRLEDRQAELSRDMAARLIVGGRFLHPSENVTFFVREITDDGALTDLFLHDQRDGDRDVTYTAHKALLFRQDDDARLVMFDGLIQTFDATENLLTKIQFDEFVFDIGTLTGAKQGVRKRVREYSTLEALFPTPQMLAATGVRAEVFISEAHQRLEQPLQSLVYPMVGFAVLLLGGFSRFGVMRQIFGAVFIVVFLSALAVPMRDMLRKDTSLWYLIYLPDIIGIIIVLLLIRVNSLRGRFKFRRRKGAAA